MKGTVAVDVSGELRRLLSVFSSNTHWYVCKCLLSRMSCIPRGWFHFRFKVLSLFIFFSVYVALADGALKSASTFRVSIAINGVTSATYGLHTVENFGLFQFVCYNLLWPNFRLVCSNKLLFTQNVEFKLTLDYNCNASKCQDVSPAYEWRLVLGQAGLTVDPSALR